MDCPCIKKREFDIVISNRGCEYLVLEDQSVWVQDFGYEKPETFEVTIKIDSRNIEKKVTLKTNGKNILTSKDLFDSTDLECLPDDVYCISTVSCGYELTINKANLCGVKSKLNELIYKYAETMNADQRKIIFDLKLLIQSIEVNAEQDNITTARRLFKDVKDKLKAYHCDNC